MPKNTWISWGQVGAILTGMAALATVHGAVIVPAILDKAEIKATSLDRIVAESAATALSAHIIDSNAAKARVVTRDEFALFRDEMDRIHAQLERIEAKLDEGRR